MFEKLSTNIGIFTQIYLLNSYFIPYCISLVAITCWIYGIFTFPHLLRLFAVQLWTHTTIQAQYTYKNKHEEKSLVCSNQTFGQCLLPRKTLKGQSSCSFVLITSSLFSFEQHEQT